MSLKESIAAIIFDYEGENYLRPSEEDASKIAEKILTRLNFHPVEDINENYHPETDEASEVSLNWEMEFDEDEDIRF
jgi:hypothetical protein